MTADLVDPDLERIAAADPHLILVTAPQPDRADLALISTYGPGVAEAFSAQPVVRGTRLEREGAGF